MEVNHAKSEAFWLLLEVEDEICHDVIVQEKKKPNKVISTKDRHKFTNFLNIKEKEKKELEEEEKVKSK